jgi:hypothetical protein
VPGVGEVGHCVMIRACMNSTAICIVALALALDVSRARHASATTSTCEVVCPPGSQKDNEKCGDEDNDFCATFPHCEGPFPNCCDAHDGIGCDDPACMASVCSYDPHCCEVGWDTVCATEACSDAFCQCDHVSVDPSLVDCGQSVCGTFWADGESRDVDPFEIDVDKHGLYAWRVAAAAPATVAITSIGCANVTIFAMKSGDCPEAAGILEPGHYFVSVSPDRVDGLPCGGSNAYVATLTCDVCFTDINDSGVTDVDDLLMVINGWGVCEKQPCVSDADLNGTTEVDDLLQVINRWGACE